MGALLDEWSPQAGFDLRVLRSLLAHVSHVVPDALLPRLCALDGDEFAVRTRHAKVRAGLPAPGPLSSPRKRWAHEYGTFVREVEWVTGELSKHMSEVQLEHLVVDEMARGIGEWARPLQDGFQKLLEHAGGGDSDTSRTGWLHQAEELLGPRVGRLMFSSFNLAGFLVGPVEVVRFEPVSGELELHIGECAFHTVAGDGKAQQRGCLWVCKGACERVFGAETGLALTLEPELPALGCRMRLSWQGV